jgi:voltage-gated potassium channel
MPLVRDRLLRRIYSRLVYPIAGFAAILIVGTIGYRMIGGPYTSVVDALYMTFITVATIGYSEVVDLSHSPGGRVFTMAIATAGILNFTYMMSAFTAFLIEGDINQALRRRSMQKRIDKLTGHYIICGIGRVGTNVAHELSVTDREYVIIDVNQHQIDEFRERHRDVRYLHGDGSEDEVLLDAGIRSAAGVFAISGEDSKNLVITLSAKQLNPAVRVVARCHEVNYIEKIRKVGADAIVSPDFTGGMRIASSMIRPQVVSFLDEMLRMDNALRVEDILVPKTFAPTTLGELGLRKAEYVLLAVRAGGKWVFNPQHDYILQPGDTLIVMTTPGGRQTLESLLTA